MSEPTLIVTSEEDMRAKINEWLDTLHLDSLDVDSEVDEDMGDTIVTVTITGVPKG